MVPVATQHSGDGRFSQKKKTIYKNEIISKSVFLFLLIFYHRLEVQVLLAQFGRQTIYCSPPINGSMRSLRCDSYCWRKTVAVSASLTLFKSRSRSAFAGSQARQSAGQTVEWFGSAAATRPGIYSCQGRGPQHVFFGWCRDICHLLTLTMAPGTWVVGHNRFNGSQQSAEKRLNPCHLHLSCLVRLPYGCSVRPSPPTQWDSLMTTLQRNCGPPFSPRCPTILGQLVSPFPLR
jgi:hypothetical protein